MLQRMTPQDVIRWEEFRAHEPLPWQQIVHMLAKVCEVVGGLAEDREHKHVLYMTERGKRMHADDFMPKWWNEVENLAAGRPPNYRPAPKRQSPEEVMAILAGLDRVVP